MMNRITRLLPTLTALIVLTTLLGACQSAPAEPMPPDFQIMFEREPCFGTCPVYALKVSADGMVVYEGIRFVAVEGRQTATLSDAQVMDLYHAVRSARFFDLEDSYTVPATDLPPITTTVTMQGQTKRVYHYGVGCGTDLDTAPPALCEIEALLEAIPASQGWVSGN